MNDEDTRNEQLAREAGVAFEVHWRDSQSGARIPSEFPGQCWNAFLGDIDPSLTLNEMFKSIARIGFVWGWQEGADAELIKATTIEEQ